MPLARAPLDPVTPDCGSSPLLPLLARRIVLSAAIVSGTVAQRGRHARGSASTPSRADRFAQPPTPHHGHFHKNKGRRQQPAVKLRQSARWNRAEASPCRTLPIKALLIASTRPASSHLINHLLRDSAVLDDERVRLRRERASEIIGPISHQPTPLLQQMPSIVGALCLVTD